MLVRPPTMPPSRPEDGLVVLVAGGAVVVVVVGGWRSPVTVPSSPPLVVGVVVVAVDVGEVVLVGAVGVNDVVAGAGAVGALITGLAEVELVGAP